MHKEGQTREVPHSTANGLCVSATLPHYYTVGGGGQAGGQCSEAPASIINGHESQREGVSFHVPIRWCVLADSARKWDQWPLYSPSLQFPLLPAPFGTDTCNVSAGQRDPAQARQSFLPAVTLSPVSCCPCVFYVYTPDTVRHFPSGNVNSGYLNCIYQASEAKAEIPGFPPHGLSQQHFPTLGHCD